jgi:hypothetical protein
VVPAVLLRELASLTADVDAQRAAGSISSAEHVRLLGDVHAVLEAHGWSWETIEAAKPLPQPAHVVGINGDQQALFQEDD